MAYIRPFSLIISPKFETAPKCVPVGLEIFGLPLTEDKLIEIAYAYEQQYPMRQKPILK